MEDYCFTIKKGGQKSLDILDQTFNDQTISFLNKFGLKSGMQVLDIGCGLGKMTQHLAEQVGDDGKILAVDNNKNQLMAAQDLCPQHLQNRIEWSIADIYELEKLNKQFDLVYCRFVLHHVHKPRFALSQISKVLKPKGLYIGAEGIINYAFSFPEHAGWRSPNYSIEVEEGLNRNGNIGKILPKLINENNMECFAAEIFQPILVKKEIRDILLINECIDNKEFQIKNGHITEEIWQKNFNSLKSCISDPSIIIGFYAACFVAASLSKR